MSAGTAGSSHRWVVTWTVCAALLLSGCGSTGDPPGTRCDPPVRTAAGKPAHVFILGGEVTCEQATSIMREYFRALQRGEAPGMGGGGPVRVGPWTCISGPATRPDTSCTAGDERAIEAQSAS